MTPTASDIVVLTGASGFTGRVVTRQLLAIGCRLRIIARPSSDLGEFEGQPQVEVVRGEVFDAETVRRACAGCNYILHMAASYREAKYGDDFYRDVHVTSTRLLAEQALAQSDFRRFVHISTVGVHGHIDEPPADESYRFDPGDIYQQTKAEAELWIRQLAAERGLPLTVIRPTAIMGPGDRRLLKLFKMAKMPLVPLLGFTRGLYHFIHVEDLARCIIAATDPALPAGAVYICGNREASSVREIVAEVGDLLGRTPRFLRIPAWPFFLLGFVVEKICVPLGVEPPIYRRRVAFFTKDRAFDTRRMQAAFGALMQFDNRSGIRQTAEWYRQQQWL
jgi:nucleoside-diphosphate-sugar epimerase